MKIDRRAFGILLAQIAILGARRPMAGTHRCPQIGVNLAGADFRAIGNRWKWPSIQNLDYYLGNGVRLFRIPFKWSRLQPELGKSLDYNALAGLGALLRKALAANATIVLDMHDYGRRSGEVIGSTGAAASESDFAYFWGQMAQIFGHDSRIWYGLMNEPHDQDPENNIRIQKCRLRSYPRATRSGSCTLLRALLGQEHIHG